MLNLPEDTPGSYVDLLNRLTRNVKRQEAGQRILEIMQRLFEQELEKEHLVLSRPERKRLYRQVTKAVLTEVLGGLDDRPKE